MASADTHSSPPNVTPSVGPWTRPLWVVLVLATHYPAAFAAIWKGLSIATPCASCRHHVAAFQARAASAHWTPSTLVLRLRNDIAARTQRGSRETAASMAHFARRVMHEQTQAAWATLRWVAKDWDVRRARAAVPEEGGAQDVADDAAYRRMAVFCAGVASLVTLQRAQQREELAAQVRRAVLQTRGAQPLYPVLRRIAMAYSRLSQHAASVTPLKQAPNCEAAMCALPRLHASAPTSPTSRRALARSPLFWWLLVACSVAVAAVVVLSLRRASATRRAAAREL